MHSTDVAQSPITVLFDATRLLARAASEMPTGIDRVDLAYARALRASTTFDLRLLVFGRLGPYLLSPRDADRVLETVSARWQPAQTSESPAFKRVRALLDSTTNVMGAAAAESAAAAKKRKPRAFGPLRSLLKRPAGSASLRRLLAAKASFRPVYVNTSHGQLFRSAAARWLEVSGVASVFMIHDLIPLEMPEFCRAAEPARHAARLRTVARHAQAIIVNSRATGLALNKHLQTTQQRAPQIHPIPLGIDDCFSAIGAGPGLQSARPYFVAVGTIEPRKNHQLLLQVWHRLVESEGETAPRLVLIGKRGWENQNVFNLLDRSPRLAQHVIECTGFSDPEVAALIRGACALLSPSFAEGYGLPVAEALALGTPVLASDIAAHREVGGEHAEYLDPHDGLGWLAAIKDYAGGTTPRRGSRMSRITSYQPPDWSAHFSETFRLIAAAAAEY